MIRRIIKLFREHEPETEVDALVLCQVGLRHVGSGYFRNAYRVDDLPLIVKFPELKMKDGDEDGNESSVEHAAEEMRAFRRIKRLKKYVKLRKYLPTMYYMNEDSGVVVMKEYEPLSETNEDVAIANEIGRYVEKVVKCEDWDYQPLNLGRDNKGNIVILDLGRLVDV